MADVLHFDTDKALDQFLKVFWEQGCRTTTTKQLAQSRYLANSLQGLRVLGKINPGKKKVQSIIELTLRTLDQYCP